MKNRYLIRAQMLEFRKLRSNVNSQNSLDHYTTYVRVDRHYAASLTAYSVDASSQ